jgi:CHASE2 domain-containing sensor protein
MSSDSRHPRRFLPYFLRGAAVVVAAALLTTGLHFVHFFDRWENDNLDRWFMSKPPAQSNEVVLVQIDEADYQQLFQSRSPLASNEVMRLLDVIASAGPKVIGVDLDTSNWSPADLERKRPMPVIWASEVPSASAAGVCFASPALEPEKADAVVRRYLLVTPGPLGPRPSFSAAVASAALTGIACAPQHGGEHADHGDSQFINFLGRRLSFRKISAGALLKLQGTPAVAEDLGGKIVLLGGSYGSARDRYRTPVGQMDGLEILAHAVETRLHGSIGHPTPVRFFLADVFIGLCLVAIGFYVPHWASLTLAAVVVPLLAIAASLIAFQTFAYFASFIPVVAGVVCHEGLEHFLEFHQLKRENLELRRALQGK